VMKDRARLVVAACFIGLASLLAACGGRGAPTPEPTLDPGYVPTSVAQALAAAATYRASRGTPTATDTPSPPTATPTVPIPTDTPTPTLVPTSLSQPGGVVTAGGLRLRRGPGTVYGIVGVLYEADELEITAQSAAGDWLAVIATEGRKGWVYATYVDLDVPLDSIPVATEIPPTPAPAPAPTATPE